MLRRESVDCEACGMRDREYLVVREKMFGFGDAFQYVRCAGCGMLMLTSAIEDVSRYYPVSYYSYGRLQVPRWTEPKWCRWLKLQLSRGTLFQQPRVWAWAARIAPYEPAENMRRWFCDVPIKRLDARVLDVGSGSGRRLRQMYFAGYSRLVGIDPYHRSQQLSQDGFQIRQQTLEEVNDGPFDIVMFNHSIEHMRDHLRVMQEVDRLLSPGGACLVRMPLADGRPMKEYGVDWVEIDAPRHLVIHTQTSFEKLLERTGFRVVKKWFDSDAFSYWGSELYARSTALVDGRTSRFRNPEEYFSSEEIRRFATLAQKDNRDGQAGRGGYWITRISE